MIVNWLSAIFCQLSLNFYKESLLPKHNRHFKELKPYWLTIISSKLTITHKNWIMKISIFIYTAGLILIAMCILLMLHYPDSNRFQMIAGSLILVGFLLNITGFVMKRSKTANWFYGKEQTLQFIWRTSIEFKYMEIEYLEYLNNP